MNVIFFEENRTDLLPIVFAKPIAKILIGITTIEEKWSSHLCVANENISYQTENFLSKKFPLKTAQENLYINSSFLPNEEVAHFILNELKSNEALEVNDKIVAAKSSQENFKNYLFENIINIMVIKTYEKRLWFFLILMRNSCQAVSAQGSFFVESIFERKLIFFR